MTSASTTELRLMDVGNDNFNLLVPLAALLSERNVTSAAKILHVGQPAMSAALARLRRHYGDELLVRIDNTYQLTPLAESLVEIVGSAVDLSSQALRMDPTIDVAELHRTFVIGMSELELDVLAPEIVERIHRIAPHVKINFDMNTIKHLDDMSNHLLSIDCMTMPGRWGTGFPSTPLFSDTLCLAVAVDNAMPSEGFAVEDLDALRWVASGDGSFIRSAVSEMFDYDIPDSHIMSTTDSVYSLSAIVAGSGLAGILPRRVIARTFRAGPIRIVVPPRPEPMIRINLVWHSVRSRDKGLDWLRGVILDSAASLEPVDGPEHIGV